MEHPEHEDQVDHDQEQFITDEDVLAEVPDDGDQLMDEDYEDEEDDTVGELVPGSSGSVEDNSYILHNRSQFPGERTIWDSVVCVGWSYDGEIVSTGGMDGKIRLWRRVGKENYRSWEFLTELQGPDEVMFLKWHPKGNVLLAGSNDTTLWLWQLPTGNTMQVFAGHTGPVQCGTFTPDGKRIVSACGDGTLILWDPRSPTPVFKLTAQDARFDLDGITSLGVNPSSTLAVVGGAAGGVRVVSLTKGEVVSALGGHTEGESVEAVEFIDLTGAGSGPGVVATGATDGKICLWDLSTMRLRSTVEHSDAVTTLLAVPPPNNHLLISGSADKTLRTWDARTGTLIKAHRGHQGPILGASLGLNGVIISGLVFLWSLSGVLTFLDIWTWYQCLRGITII
ncbi:ribosome biogenesis protein sqt1 [Lentinula edodes]|uniref:Ribosome biogenesis protein sqt1 n=1 Tax=Lentinula edodes TaxID=5353 RepID=A0A1Q3E4I0_LENED|nr:ribosome biogenesis protein sqt1 [Lentinula edodes]